MEVFLGGRDAREVRPCKVSPHERGTMPDFAKERSNERVLGASGGGRNRLEGRRSGASQPYRFVSRSVPRHPFSSNFAELGSPQEDNCKGRFSYPYREYRKLWAVLVYAARRRLTAYGCGRTRETLASPSGVCGSALLVRVSGGVKVFLGGRDAREVRPYKCAASIAATLPVGTSISARARIGRWVAR